jgi:hypothetical protein
MKRILPASFVAVLLIAAMILLGAPVAAQQGGQPTAAPTQRPTQRATVQPNRTAVPGGTAVPGSTSSVQAFVVLCNNQAVINLTGNMRPNFDAFYQVFSGPKGTGSALTDLRRVVLDGQYAFSEVVPYTSGATLATGAIGSVRVIVARETNSNSRTIDTTIDDLQDGCNSPQNPLGTSSDTGVTVGTLAPSGSTTGSVLSGPAILSPFGGFLNNPLTTPQPVVVIGARTVVPARSNNPGLIFAECDNYRPRAEPGTVYDTDNVVVFWSWFAKTAQQVQDHIAHAKYAITFNRTPFQQVNVSAIQQREDNNFWVFYTAPIGNLRPGTYGVEFRLSWDQKISDGFADYGPGTSNQSFLSTCTFRVEPNPTGGQPSYNNIYSLHP